MEIIIQNVRSMVKRQTIPLAPLTLLIGENSSGKSTFLAILSALSDPLSYPFSPRFNDAPYKLGSYDTIATYKGGKYGRAKSFTIGHRQSSGERTWNVLANYISNRGQIQLSRFTIKSNLTDLEFSVNQDNRNEYKGKLTTRHRELGVVSHQFVFDKEGAKQNRFDFQLPLIRSISTGQVDPKAQLRLMESIFDLGGLVSPIRSVSIAPIRTKPIRTYDQVSDQYDPEGQHVPFVLARLLTKGASSQERDTLLKGLRGFGKESGLFSQISVKPLGSKVGDPFQIMVTPSGRAANLLDVGYGVSQALPVVVQSILVEKSQLLLLQQPEVHLHPRAQAALGSFFVQQVTDADKRFVIETHSDFIVDRIRQEVAKGNIGKDRVRILFFQKREFDTNIYQLELDDLGNILGAPPGYREFFLREELNLFGETGGNA